MNCHCQYCRKAHSAPYISATLMPESDLIIQQGNEYISEFDIDGVRKRRFCNACGTRIYNMTSVANYITFMAATLDHPEVATPMGHVNVESKLATLEITDDLPQFKTFPSGEQIAGMLSKNH